jgi:hypothetical protein
MAQTRVDGVVIRYDDRGDGEPTLLCLAGLCDDRSVFDGRFVR